MFALIPFKNERHYLPGLLLNISPHVDGIVALDDGSTDGSADVLKEHPLVMRVIRKDGKVWDDGENHRILYQAALDLGGEWAYGIDADERVEMSFRGRLNKFMEMPQYSGIGSFGVKVWDLWGSPVTRRVDGYWANKTKPCLFQLIQNPVFDMKKFHGSWSPINLKPPSGYPILDLAVYHLHMITEAGQRWRSAKYEKLDSCHEFQKIGYTYMLSTDGLRLEPLPRGREYVPVETPHEYRFDSLQSGLSSAVGSSEHL